MLSSPLLVLAGVGLYGVVHSLLASLWAKAQARRRFGKVAGRWYRLVYNLLATLTLLPVLALPLELPDRPLYALPAPWSFAALLGQLLALGLLAVGLLQTGVWSFIGLRQLVEPESQDAGAELPRLVVNGLYRWVRHPLYTAGLVFIWLLPLMTVNLLALNLGLTVYIVIGALFEERKLRREFGAAYERYQRQTPMLLPGLKRLHRR
jgi:protein-S-isoprenylcysteine O-methyltransferase Ste14